MFKLKCVYLEYQDMTIIINKHVISTFTQREENLPKESK